MRLIDADALKKVIEEADYFDIEQIDDAPTVDAVKHGHWMLAGYMGQGTRLSKCSICGWQTPDDGDYCSSCGAKMDEEVE